MAKHYVCTGGCKGVSDKPGVCQMEDCARYNEALEECDCTDGTHYGAFDFEHDHDASMPEVIDGA